MKKKSIVLTAAVCALALVSALCLLACNGKHTGGTAATVNGVEIPEDKVTDYIQDLREAYGLTDQNTWGSYLSMYGMTPESLRSTVLDNFINLEANKVAASQRGITVSDEEVSDAVAKMKANYKTDSEWQNALKSAGFDEEDKYRDSVKDSLLEQKLTEAIDFGGEVTDEAILEACQTFAPKFNGARKSSHILFAAEDTEKAQSILDAINDGSLDFAEAAEENSTDTGSAADGGNVGWDCVSTFVDEYQTALSGLSKDEVSGLVTSQFGIHIIKCTDVFDAPETITSPDQLPADLREIAEKYAQSQAEASDFSAWIKNFRSTLDIVINNMPTKVPYNVDMTQYANTNTAATNAVSTSSTEGTEGADSGEGTDSGESGEATKSE